MYAKRSVSTRIAKYLFVVIIFMGIISSLSLIVMASNKSDAEAINISGSLRMQSYRLLTEMERFAGYGRTEFSAYHAVSMPMPC